MLSFKKISSQYPTKKRIANKLPNTAHTLIHFHSLGPLHASSARHIRIPCYVLVYVDVVHTCVRAYVFRVVYLHISHPKRGMYNSHHRIFLCSKNNTYNRLRKQCWRGSNIYNTKTLHIVWWIPFKYLTHSHSHSIQNSLMSICCYDKDNHNMVCLFLFFVCTYTVYLLGHVYG